MRHRFRMRVPFGDVDHAGLVYYLRIFHYLHLAYESFFHDALGVPFQERFDQGRIGVPIVSAKAAFRAPLHHGDEIEIGAWISQLGRHSWTWQFELRPAAAPRALPSAAGSVAHAFVGGDRCASRRSRPPSASAWHLTSRRRASRASGEPGGE